MKNVCLGKSKCIESFTAEDLAIAFFLVNFHTNGREHHFLTGLARHAEQYITFLQLARIFWL